MIEFVDGDRNGGIDVRLTRAADNRADGGNIGFGIGIDREIGFTVEGVIGGNGFNVFVDESNCRAALGTDQTLAGTDAHARRDRVERGIVLCLDRDRIVGCIFEGRVLD